MSRPHSPVIDPPPIRALTMIQLNGSFQTALLIAVCIVVVVGVAGAVFAPELGTQIQILGFSAVTAASLIGLLQNSKAHTKLDEISEHVNSAFGHALELTAHATKATAEATGKPRDIEIAKLAREASDSHKKGQARVDAQSSTRPRTHAAVAKETKTMKEDVDVAVEQIVDTVEESGEQIKDKIDEIS